MSDLSHKEKRLNNVIDYLKSDDIDEICRNAGIPDLDEKDFPEQFGFKGYWLNYENGEAHRICEHEVWIRKPENYRLMGITDELASTFDDYRVKIDRIRFLTMIFREAPVVRIRGQRQYENRRHVIVLEYHSEDCTLPHRAIIDFGRENFSPFDEIVVNNLHDGSSINCTFGEFCKGAQR